MCHFGRCISHFGPRSIIQKPQTQITPHTASTGSDNKVEALRGLGFDEVFNYKTTEVAQALDKAAPEGIDVYWVRGVVCCGLFRHGKISFPS